MLAEQYKRERFAKGYAQGYSEQFVKELVKAHPDVSAETLAEARALAHSRAMAEVKEADRRREQHEPIEDALKRIRAEKSYLDNLERAKKEEFAKGRAKGVAETMAAALEADRQRKPGETLGEAMERIMAEKSQHR